MISASNPITSRYYLSGIVLVILGTFCFSMKSIFIKLAYGYGVDTVTLLTLRMAMATPFYVAVYVHQVCGSSERAPPKAVIAAMLTGVTGYYLASYLDLAGLQYLSANIERLLLFTYPIFVLVFGSLFFRRAITLTQCLAGTLSYGGIYVALAGSGEIHGNGVLMGVMLVLASAVAFALFMVSSERWIPLLGSKRFTSIAMMSAAALVMVQFALSRSLKYFDLPIEVYGLGFLLATVSTVLPSYLMAAGIARIGAIKTAIIGAIGPIFTALVAKIVLNEPYTIFHMVGTILVVAGILVITQSRGPGKKND